MGGVGVFFLVLKCAVLLCGAARVVRAVIYVDDHGEDDVGLRRGAPWRLHAARAALARHNTPGRARGGAARRGRRA